jgi:hypothetical protein
LGGNPTPKLLNKERQQRRAFGLGKERSFDDHDIGMDLFQKPDHGGLGLTQKLVGLPAISKCLNPDAS